MFTGIVRERGRVASIERQGDGVRLEIAAPETASTLGVGDSVSVSGACLTATAVSDKSFSVTAVPETLSRTTLGRLSEGGEVNLEPALHAGDPLGGHFVQGHVDSTGRIERIDQREHSRVVSIGAPPEVLRFVVEKGSIAVDGVSLTVSAIDDESFSVSLIPETLGRTTLGAAEPGRPVNLEVDVLAKYVEKLIA